MSESCQRDLEGLEAVQELDAPFVRKMINASMLDVVAAFQRRGWTPYRTVRGHACYLFEGNGELLRDSILAKPMKRGELESVALLATPRADYSLRTSAKVMYSRGEDGVLHISAEGETSSVSSSDLIGAAVLSES